METLRKHKKEIIISLVTGIFLFYVQPVLNFLGEIFVRTFILLSDTFSNDYYTSVAKNDPNTFADWSNFLLIIIISIILFYSISYIGSRRKDLKKRIEKTLKDIASSKERLTKNETEEEKSKDEILKELATFEDDATQIQESLSKRDNKLLTLYILSFFLMVLLFTNYALTKAISSENVEFRNDLIKIAPCSNDTEIKLIEAKWVSMKNKVDYRKIKDTIEDIKKKNKIE
jgi:predicted PurR-regulated permease PerM